MFCAALAGCLGAEPDAVQPLEAFDAPLGFVANQTANAWVIETPAGCVGFCEPMVAVGPNDTVFVKGDTLWRHDATGWQPFFPPSSPAVAGHRTFQTDRAIDVAPDGRLWWHTLIGGITEATGQFQYLGVQIAHSRDGGDSWQDITHIRLDADHPVGAHGADRQWLGFADDRTYITYQRNTIFGVSTPLGSVGPDVGNVWIASSPDAASWSDFRPIDTIDLGSDHATGQMVVREDGIYVPFVRTPGNGGLSVAHSRDGTTWTTTSTETQGTFFPALTKDGNQLRLVASDGAGGLTMLTSPDGTDWQAQAAPVAQGVISSPWLVADEGGVWTAWLQRTQGTSDRFGVHLATPEGLQLLIAENLLGSPSSRANTDFIHARMSSAGPIVVAGDNDTGQTRLYIPR